MVTTILQQLSDVFPEEANPYAGMDKEELEAALSQKEGDGETAELLEKCLQWVLRYLVVTREQSVVLAAWVLHTHAIEAAECTPYLHITAPEKECGKTQVLRAVKPLVRNPWFTGRVSAAVLVRKVDKEKPCLLLDESDAAFKGAEEYSEALRGLLNAGHERGGVASLCVGKGAEIGYKDFSCFCPKAIAGIGKIPDTIASRSIVIAMRRKAHGEMVAPFRSRDVDNAAFPLRSALEEWVSKETIETLKAARPQMPDSLGDRQKDISEPLVAIADLAGGKWPALVRQSLTTLFGSAASEDDSIGVQLLRDIHAAFGSSERMASAELAQILCAMEGCPWADWARGKGLDASRLAKQLRKYGIAPRQMNTGGSNLRGYQREQFADVWTRYCPHVLKTGGLSAIPATIRMNTGDTSHSLPATKYGLPVIPLQKAPNVAAATRYPLPYPLHKNPYESRVVAGIAAVAAPTDTSGQPDLFEVAI